MDNLVPCRCSGFNADCVYCGGSGRILSGKIEIIKTEATEKVLKKEIEDLDEYLHKGGEKLYESKPTITPRKKTKNGQHKFRSDVFGLNDLKKKGITVLDNTQKSTEEIRRLNKSRSRPVKNDPTKKVKNKKRSRK